MLHNMLCVCACTRVCTFYSSEKSYAIIKLHSRSEEMATFALEKKITDFYTRQMAAIIRKSICLGCVLGQRVK